MNRLLFFSLVIFAASAVRGAEAPPVTRMNGYSLSQFGDFTQSWRLVTVRFRKDTGEMRFTYANPSAWATLSANRTDYADGAVFAKVGVATQPDPIFESSAVPQGARRVQFMVRDRAKHKETDGWGYAIFNPSGAVLAGEQKPAALACAACHRLAAPRGYVFSQLMGLDQQVALFAPPAALMRGLKFKTRKAVELPPSLRDLLKAKLPAATEVGQLEGPLTRHVFFGTLDEIVPALAREAVRRGQPAVLVSDDEAQFSLVYKDPAGSCAAAGETAMKVHHTTAQKKDSPLYESTFCQAR